jgi:hypothetical protein
MCFTFYYWNADFRRMRWAGLVAHVDTRNAFVVGYPEVWRHVE